MPALPEEPVAALRALAARDRLPGPYKWLAREASYDELVWFLALEGGPDGGFDDLVAVCQVGLDGSAKRSSPTTTGTRWATATRPPCTPSCTG